VTNSRKTIVLSVQEVAQALNLGVNSAYALVRSGRLRSVRIGRRILVPCRELDAFLEREAQGDLLLTALERP
jgi:excisionase family DNA binding protein